MLSWLTRPNAKSTRLSQLFRAIFQFIEFAAILVAIFAFFMELGNRQKERTAQAWQLLATKAPGNSGKIEALEYLNREESWRYCPAWWPLNKARSSLEGIDLTPPAIPEKWDFGQQEGRRRTKPKRKVPKECPQFTYLQKVKLVDAKLDGAILVCSDLYKANLEKASLRGADLRNARLLEANLRETDFTKADLRGTHLGSVSYGVHSTAAKLEGARLRGADLRGATMVNCAQLKEATNWALAYRDGELACGETIPDAP